MVFCLLRFFISSFPAAIAAAVVSSAPTVTNESSESSEAVTSTSGPLFYGKMTLGNSGMASVLQRGYIQFKQGQTTRVKRVRPVYAVTDQAAIEQVSVVVETTNKPYATPSTSATAPSRCGASKGRRTRSDGRRN